MISSTAAAAPAEEAKDPFATGGAAEAAPAEVPEAGPDSAASPEPAPAEPDWSSMMNRTITFKNSGRPMRGKLKSHSADTATIVEANGAVSDIPKASMTEVQMEVPTPKEREAFEDNAPRRRSETARAARRAAGADAEVATTGSFRDRGKFLLISPGLVAVPFSALDFVMYRWGFSVGAMIPSEKSSFLGAYGFTFEHFAGQKESKQTIDIPFEGPTTIHSKVASHRIRALAELRLGWSGDKVFGYVLLGAGLSVVHAAVTTDGDRVTANAAAFAIPVGVGLQGMLGDHFILGFEPRAIFDISGQGSEGLFDARLLLGAKF